MKSEQWNNCDQRAAETLLLLKGNKGVDAVTSPIEMPNMPSAVAKAPRNRSRACSPLHDIAAPASEELSSSVSFDSSDAVDQDNTSNVSHNTIVRRASRLRIRHSYDSLPQAALQQAAKPVKPPMPAASSHDSMLTNLPLLSAIFAHQASGHPAAVTRCQSNSFPNSPVHPSLSDGADHRPAARRFTDATASTTSAASADSRSHHISSKRASSPGPSHLSDRNPRLSKLPRSTLLSAIAPATDTHSPSRQSTSSSPAVTTPALKAPTLTRSLPVPKSHLVTNSAAAFVAISRMESSSSRPAHVWMVVNQESSILSRCMPASGSRSLLQQLPIMQQCVVPSVHVYGGFSQARLSAAAISIGDGTPA